MHLITKYFTLLAALMAIAAFAAGCGGDDEPSDSGGGDTAAQTEPATEEPGAAAGEIDEENLRAFIDAINEDPSIICDPDNATAELLESAGGQEACEEAAATEEGGQEYEITDLQIDGATATAVIEDADGPNTANFVQEGDQLKFTASE